jgi:hypothetical protein
MARGAIVNFPIPFPNQMCETATEKSALPWYTGTSLRADRNCVECAFCAAKCRMSSSDTDAPSAETIAYLRRHDLPLQLEGLLQDVLDVAPRDPLVMMARRLRTIDVASKVAASPVALPAPEFAAAPFEPDAAVAVDTAGDAGGVVASSVAEDSDNASAPNGAS